MSPCSSNALFLTSFIRKLRGGSQPILAEASDGLRYVVKFTNNLQGPNLCFNESMGTELFRACNLPVAEWRPISVSWSFIEQNPGCWIETPDGLLRPAVGLCFGSRFLGGSNLPTFEILPRSYFERVSNRKDFWLVWLVDVSANHTDSRQAIFQTALDESLKAVFLDHGHMFGGATGLEDARLRASCYPDLRIYPDILQDFMVTFQQVAAILDADKLWHQVSLLPAEWRSESALGGFEKCLGRLSSSRTVDDILNEATGLNRQSITCDELFPSSRRKPVVSVLRPELRSRTRQQRATA